MILLLCLHCRPLEFRRGGRHEPHRKPSSNMPAVPASTAARTHTPYTVEDVGDAADASEAAFFFHNPHLLFAIGRRFRQQGANRAVGRLASVNRASNFLLGTQEVYLEARDALLQGVLERSAAATLPDALKPDRFGRTAVIRTICAGRFDDALVLISMGASERMIRVDEADLTGCPPLAHAAAGGSAAVVEALLANGAGISITDREGITPLMRAAGAGSFACVKLLLDAGSEVNAATKDGNTALIRAAMQGDASVVQLMCSCKADVHASNKQTGRNALMQIAEKERPQALKVLIEANAHLDCVDESGETALHKAARRGNVETAAILIQQGVPLQLKNKSGDTALQVAQHARKCPMLDQLIEQLIAAAQEEGF